MPYVPHMRLTVRGVFMGPAAPVEEWQWGVNLQGIQGDPGTVQATDLASAVDAVTDLWSAPTLGMSNLVRVREVKLAPIGAAGKYTSDPLIANVDIPGGLASPPTYPPQVALVVSLMTPRRGPSGRGRVYLPSPNFAIGSDWRMPQARCDDIAAAFGNFVRDLARTGGDTPFPTDALYTVIVASTKGENNPVNAVRVGQALDTVRSRRRGLVENYRVNDTTTNVTPLPGR
jgi:hypothetical protein